MPTLPRTVEVLERGIAGGLHIGAQVYVSVRGEPVADFALGESRPGVAMTPETIMLWLSSGKPIGAVALARLWERGLLDLDDPVCRHIPEFAQNGKEAVTLRHVLTHTGGFRAAVPAWSLDPWEDLIARLCAAPLEPDWIPGEKAGYHQATGWMALAEVVRRVDGRPFEVFAQEEIFRPLGMDDCWFAIPPERYRAYGECIGIMQNTEGERMRAHVWDREERCALPRPGGSAHGPIRALGRFYETLLFRGSREGVRLLAPQTVEALTARHRVGMFDHTFQHVIDWGLGFIPDSKQYGVDTIPYGYGPHASRRTFGHSGYQSSTGYCDPAHDLVVAVVANGTPGERRNDARFRALNAAIYEDLGLAGG